MYTLYGKDCGNLKHYIKECEKMIKSTESLRKEKYERFKKLIKKKMIRKYLMQQEKSKKKLEMFQREKKREIKCKYRYFRIQ